MLPVAVEIAPPNAPRAHVAVLLAACSRAVAEADCVLAADAAPTGARAVAIVTWHSEAEVLIEVGLRVDGAPIWRSRSMTFRAGDDTAERWRAVGFTLGTLARGAQRQEPAPSTEEPRESSRLEAKEPTPAPAPSKASQNRRADERRSSSEPEAEPDTAQGEPRELTPAAPVAVSQFALDVGVRGGPVWDGMRVGGVVRARLPLYGWLRTIAAASYTQRSTQEMGLGGQWLTFALGAGAFAANRHGELGASIDARLEYLNATAKNSAREQSGVLRRFGAGLTLSAAWTPAAPIGLFVAGDFAFVGSRTDVNVSERVVQSEPALRGALEAGARLRF